jgi:Uma2 family endonuclease
LGYAERMSTALNYEPTLLELLAAVPEHQTGELVNGALHVSPRPGPSHAAASFNLGVELGPPFERGRGGPGGWRILFEPELHLGEDVLVPDLAGWRVETLPTRPTQAHFVTRPDWVCEVLSPSNRRLDRTLKMSVYARHGVEHLRLVDPADRTLEVYRRAAGEGMWTLLSTFIDDDLVTAEPFAAAPFRLGVLWWEDTVEGAGT